MGVTATPTETEQLPESEWKPIVTGRYRLRTVERTKDGCELRTYDFGGLDALSTFLANNASKLTHAKGERIVSMARVAS